MLKTKLNWYCKITLKLVGSSRKKIILMTSYLDITEDELRLKKGYWTAREITQQPKIWQEVAQTILNSNSKISSWLDPILEKKNLRIILTGAGTSAYVGEAIAPYLTKHLLHQVEAVSTTNLVGSPDQYLLKNTPTLIISYARSGNSPESLAACELGDQIIDDCYHLAITCSKNSKLVSYLNKKENGHIILMPEATLDQSFAMTSSFSSMLMASLCVFSPDEAQLNTAVELSRTIINRHAKLIKEHASIPFSRSVFLGSGGLLGIATEAQLKMLELSAGKIDSYAESSLGFRHGPKLIVDEKTLVVMLSSNDKHTKKYDGDLMRELITDHKTEHVFDLSEITDADSALINDAWLSLPYIVYCQILAFYKSLYLDITPDNPCPTGEANRVVQGVTIHPFKD